MPGGMLCAEAHAGMQIRAIPEDRMKVVRRMGNLPLGKLFAASTTNSHISGAHHCEVGHTGRFFVAGCAGSLGDFLSPSPPAEKAGARQDQTGQASADDWAGHGDRRICRGTLIEIGI
jgi:hypothetical protein